MKKRDQPIYTYFETLQLEYLVFELRNKISWNPKDKNFYKKLTVFKETKIKQIAIRNSLQTIFNSDDKKQEFIDLIYGKKGYPNFDIIDYKSEQEREEFRIKDLMYYYTLNCDYRIEIEEGQFKIGSLVEIFHDKGVCHVKLRKDKDITVSSINCLTRIL